MSNRKHWESHSCCIPVSTATNQPNHGMTAIVYSAKNEGDEAYVLLNVRVIGFDCDAKMTSARARDLASALVSAADRADAVESSS